MPITLRKALSCHYCGHKSDHKYTHSLKSWQCRTCEAVNHLDENGDITDPPAQSVNRQSPPQFARRALRVQSPDLASQGSTFCSRCVTNQHLVTENLKEYLPSANHPQYQKYVDNYDAYKQDLETRYPPVCADCEPRVNERLKATTYAARADHLRRNLQAKPRQTLALQWQRWTGKRLLVFFAGLLWWFSILAQSAWHAMALLPTTSVERARRDQTWSCMLTSVMEREQRHGCVEATRSIAWSALLAGSLTFWWNNKLSAKLYSRSRRLMGVGAYLQVQMLSLSARGTALYLIDNSELVPLNLTRKALHAASLVFMVATTMFSLTIVKLARPPSPNFSDYRPVSGAPSSDPILRAPHQALTPFEARDASSQFPVSTLTKPKRSSFAVTPPAQPASIREQAEMEMDWTPTGPSQIMHLDLKPVIEYRRPDGPNPFHGTLPPAPRAPSHKARNPYNIFLAASDEKKSNFMSNIRGDIRGATGTPDDEDDEATLSFGKAKTRSGFEIQPGRMRDFAAENASSGLEDLFNTAFTIRERSIEDVTTASRAIHQRQPERNDGFVMSGDDVRRKLFWAQVRLAVIGGAVMIFGICIATGWIDPGGIVKGMLHRRGLEDEVDEG